MKALETLKLCYRDCKSEIITNNYFSIYIVNYYYYSNSNVTYNLIIIYKFD